MLSRGAVLALALVTTGVGNTNEALPPGLDIVQLGAGRLFVNADGLALYTFKRDREMPGTSVCNFGCQEQWPPVLASQGASPVGEWSTVQRDDGTHQWAYRGSPVYTNAGDTHPGSLVGEKAGLWDVLFQPMAVPPSLAVRGTLTGQTLVDLDGRTLYWNTSAKCTGACLQDRLPLEAPWAARSLGEAWTVTRRDDGLAQWAYQGRALFSYAGDYTPGEMNGVDESSGWQAAVVQDAPGVPDWVTYQETDMGPVFADQNRMTLYYLPADPEQVRRETCDDQCFAANWTPLVATAEAQPVGNWSIKQESDGTRQWHYLGWPVFTYKHDKIPGDTLGDKFGSGAAIRGGWQAMLKETQIQKLF